MTVKNQCCTGMKSCSQHSYKLYRQESFQSKEQLFGVPEIRISSGKKKVMAVSKTVEMLGITDKIQTLCPDTTSRNTGRVNGTCTYLEKSFIRELRYFVSRHPIFKLVLRNISDLMMGATYAPDITFSTHLQKTKPNSKKRFT